MGKVILILAALALSGCDEPAAEALKAQGYTSVRIGGPVILSCGRDDSISTSRRFTARRSDGVKVSGVVCCGLVFKGCTVRF